MKKLLSEEQRDALQELMNISMGQAANALALLINARVTLSIPVISAVTPKQFNAMFKQDELLYTRQSFLGSVKGEVLTLLSRDGSERLAALMDYPEPLEKEDYDELLLELANILAGACLGGFAEQLCLSTKLSMPTLFKPFLQDSPQYQWASTLLMEVEFKLACSNFDARVVICLGDSSITTLLEALNRLLE